jgi:RNA polymerase sigma-70 factor (ECF subfamily)
MGGTLATRNEQIESFRGLVKAYGFVPNLFGLQKKLPRAIEAEQRLIDAILVRESGLSRGLKDCLLRIVASAQGSNYCRALHAQADSNEGEEDVALLAFANKLAKYAPWICKHDVDALRASGFDDSLILDTVLTVALGQLLCALASALRPNLDSGLPAPASIESSGLPEPVELLETSGPYLQPSPQPASNFPPYAFFREQFGFVPKLFQEQMLRPDVVEAESDTLAQILIPEDLLSRVQKEQIVLVVSAANLNTYSVALHSQILATLGVSLENSNQIVEDYRCAPISPAEVALLDQGRKLGCRPGGMEAGFDLAPLQAHGFSEPQILEAVAMAAVTNFLNTLQAGLGAVPDFPPRRVFTRKDLYPSSGPSRLISDAIAPDDPDAAIVVRVQGGDTDAFEELVRRHSRRIFGTLAGLLGNLEDARDVTQDVFLKAFENIGRFQGRSKFSTWLISIAINAGTELLRQRKPCESLDQSGADEEFRPRQIQSWADNPEQVLAASQRSQLVREGVLRLPEKYRVVVLLRDINQLSTEEAAAALELSIPAVKARLLRGRLMLRESLAPYFTGEEKRSPDAQLR